MNKNKGITLIALVVTVIIILILTGVSFAAVVNSGIISKANEAKIKSEIADIKEQLQIALMNISLENNGEVTVQDFLDELIEEEIITSDDILSKEPENDPTEAWIIVDSYKFKIYKDDETSEIHIEYEGDLRKRPNSKFNYKNKYSNFYYRFYNHKYNQKKRGRIKILYKGRKQN